MENDNQIIFLIGPKGSGKTYIGNMIAEIFEIPFLRIESVWEAVRLSRPEYDTPDYINLPGYLEEVRSSCLDAVDNQLCAQNSVTLETTGVFFFEKYLASLRARGDVLLVNIRAKMETCLDRIRIRDQSFQIPIAEDKIKTINTQSIALEQNWDIILENDPFLSKKDIATAFSGHLLNSTAISTV